MSLSQSGPVAIALNYSLSQTKLDSTPTTETVTLEKEKPVDTTPVVSEARKQFLIRFEALGKQLAKLDEQIKQITSPPGPVTSALKTATDGKPVAEKAGEGTIVDWSPANAALDLFETQIKGIGAACLDEATKAATGFAQRYEDKNKNKPAGKDIVPKYIAYGKAKGKLDGLISGKDGIGALEACAATETALKAFETAASPSTTQKQQKASLALTTLTNLSDEALTNMSLKDKAELAMDVCANGQNSAVRAQLVRLYAKSPADPKFMEKRAAEREKIANEVMKMDEIAKLYKSNGDLDADHWKDLTDDSDKTLALMQKICNVQADSMGMPRIEVFKDPAIPAGNGTMGGYNPATNKIGINFWPAYMQPVSEAIDTIIHETFHAHQDFIVKTLKAGGIAPGDDLYPTALMCMVNDIPIGYLFSSQVGNANYKMQPTEFDSFHHAGETVTDLLSKVKTKAMTPTL